MIEIKFCNDCKFATSVPTEKWDFVIYCSKLNFVIPNANEVTCVNFKEKECQINLR